jgi:hypothetical protein
LLFLLPAAAVVTSRVQSQGWEVWSLPLERVQGAVLFVIAVVTLLVHTPWLVTAISEDVQC